jgi:hypothetical protein
LQLFWGISLTLQAVTPNKISSLLFFSHGLRYDYLMNGEYYVIPIGYPLSRVTIDCLRSRLSWYLVKKIPVKPSTHQGFAYQGPVSRKHR